MQHYFSEKLIFRTPFYNYQGASELTILADHFKNNKVFQEALYLSSPVLYDELKKWEKGLLKDNKAQEKLLQSLHKYYIRMQSRCTPYGLYAGCSVGNWGNENKVLLSGFSRHTRLDMDFLCTLAQSFSRNNTLKYHLKFFPNNSLYPIGGQLRYVEYHYANNRRIHQITSIDNNAYLGKLLQFAENGRSVSELIQSIVDEEISNEEAAGYIEELINAQVLVTELEPAVTGDEFTHQLIEKLTVLNQKVQSKEVENSIEVLKKVLAQLETIDDKTGNEIDLYRDIINDLKTLNVPVDEKVLYQADLFRNSEQASLDLNVQNELLKALHFLNKISSGYTDSNLTRFAKNYFARYEEAEMALLQVLDTESGIGYLQKDKEGVNPLLKDFHVFGNSTNELNISLNAVTNVFFQKLVNAYKEGKSVIQLNDDDFKDVTNATESFPPTMSVMFNIINKNSGKIHLQYCSGSSAANIIGRFAHGSQDIHNIALSIAKHEQELNSDQIFAEIVHLPESRLGNILLRPVFRDYEIPYLATSVVDKEHQVALKDLVVKIVNGKIILKSKKLNKEIIPRLSNAHNFSFNALPVYQFLSDLQTQYYEKSSLSFGWGGLANLFPFTPRVEYGNTVLDPATWNLRKNDFEELLKTDSTDFPAIVKKWKEKWNMPSLICLSDGDNELLVNLEDEYSVKVFANTIKKRGSIKLKEFLFDEQNALVTDENNNVYTNECIAFLLQKDVDKIQQDQLPSIALSTPNSERPVKRKFVTGDEWLYYKLYCGIKTADKILTATISPLIAQLGGENLINGWFFIRYSDPDFHIRMRLKLADVNAIGTVINRVNSFLKPFLEQGFIENVLTDTYNREIERYGNNSIEIAEYFFQTDSSTTLEMLSLIENHTDENIRWLYALRCIDDLLNSFSFTTNQKQHLLETLRNAFFAEHGGNKDLKIQLDNKYRDFKKKIQLFINPDESTTNEFTNIFHLLEKKAILLEHTVKDIHQLMNENALEISIHSLLSSYIHMMLNRIFMSRQRTHELVIYDMLNRHYQSAIARNKAKEKSKVMDLK